MECAHQPRDEKPQSDSAESAAESVAKDKENWKLARDQYTKGWKRGWEAGYLEGREAGLAEACGNDQFSYLACGMHESLLEHNPQQLARPNVHCQMLG